MVSLAWEIVHDAWDRCLQSTDSHIMGKNTLYTSHNQHQCMLNRSHCTIGHAAIAFIFITSMMSPGQYSLCLFWQKVTTVTSVFTDFQFQTTWTKMLVQFYTRQSSFLGGHPKIPGLHFARQPPVGSWNVGCFLRLMKYLTGGLPYNRSIILKLNGHIKGRLISRI